MKKCWEYFFLVLLLSAFATGCAGYRTPKTLCYVGLNQSKVEREDENQGAFFLVEYGVLDPIYESPARLEQGMQWEQRFGPDPKGNLSSDWNKSSDVYAYINHDWRVVVLIPYKYKGIMTALKSHDGHLWWTPSGEIKMPLDRNGCRQDFNPKILNEKGFIVGDPKYCVLIDPGSEYYVGVKAYFETLKLSLAACANLTPAQMRAIRRPEYFRYSWAINVASNLSIIYGLAYAEVWEEDGFKFWRAFCETHYALQNLPIYFDNSMYADRAPQSLYVIDAMMARRDVLKNQESVEAGTQEFNFITKIYRDHCLNWKGAK